MITRGSKLEHDWLLAKRVARRAHAETLFEGALRA